MGPVRGTLLATELRAFAVRLLAGAGALGGLLTHAGNGSTLLVAGLATAGGLACGALAGLVAGRVTAALLGRRSRRLVVQ